MDFTPTKRIVPTHPTTREYRMYAKYHGSKYIQQNWMKAFGHEDYQRAWTTTLLLLSESHPRGLNCKDPQQAVIRDQIVKQLRDCEELADIFDARYASEEQRNFYHKNGPKGFVKIANDKIAGRARKQRARAEAQESSVTMKDEASSSVESLAPPFVEAQPSAYVKNHLLTPKRNSSLELLEDQPFALVKDQPTALECSIEITSTTHRKIVGDFGMREVFGDPYPAPEDINLDQLKAQLDGNPYIDEHTKSLVFLYVHEGVNIPIYNDAGLKQSYRKWRMSKSVPVWRLYLDERPKEDRRCVLPGLGEHVAGSIEKSTSNPDMSDHDQGHSRHHS